MSGDAVARAPPPISFRASSTPRRDVVRITMFPVWPTTVPGAGRLAEERGASVPIRVLVIGEGEDPYISPDDRPPDEGFAGGAAASFEVSTAGGDSACISERTAIFRPFF